MTANPNCTPEQTLHEHQKSAMIPEVLSTSQYQGQWVAWDEHQESVLAFADTYSELMKEVSVLGLSNPIIERASGVHPSVEAMTFTLLPSESPNILEDVRTIIPDPDQWLDTPNTRLWFKKPRDLIGTVQEQRLRILLRGIRSGISS